jgi:outer membrane immunogenic protein
MKKLLVSVATLALTAGSAFAADLPSRKDAPILPPPPPPMWTGFYAGLNAGYGFGTNDNTQSVGVGQNAYVGDAFTINTLSPALTPIIVPTGLGLAMSSNAPTNQNGFIGGGQVGYNYQWGPNFVVGLEVDMQGTGIRGTSHGAGAGAGGAYTTGFSVFENTGSFGSVGSTSVNAGVDWMGTVRGRLGYLFTPTMLVYATGGLTYGGVHADVRNYAVETQSISSFSDGAFAANQTYIGGGNKSQTLVGWNVGGGLEWMFMPNWSIKAEGIYWNMGSMNVPTAAVAAPASTLTLTPGIWGTTPAATFGGTRVNYQGVIARAGVNYHLNWFSAAPVIAKF